ncbi:HPP family protein [Microvirga sp. W0021]|uniref:HPP family protein n=1 Tax=Hohaiivirga grylli TaxID=3133970 RepID=A0ABV0BI83_9HYPH
MKSFFTRHQPRQPLHHSALSGIGGVLAIALIGAITFYGQTPLLIAPFGASCVLLFSVPNSPLSQPANVIGGHFIATLISLVLHLALQNTWWAIALAVGLAIGVMAALRLTHPPAGADPIVVFASDPSFSFLFFPVLAGSCLLVLIATLYHRAGKVTYPMKKAQPEPIAPSS